MISLHSFNPHSSSHFHKGNLKVQNCSGLITARSFLPRPVRTTGLWLNISMQGGLLTVVKTNKPLSSLTEHEAHTGAVTPNLNTQRNKRQRRQNKREGGGGGGSRPCPLHSSQSSPPPFRPAAATEDAQKHTLTPAFFSLSPSAYFIISTPTRCLV